MKVSFDRSSAGFGAQKSEMTGKIAQLPKTEAPKEAQAAVGAKDELELSMRKTAVLGSVREANLASASTESGADRLNAIKQKLATLNDYILDNPAEAFSAQANLNSGTVARLVG